MTIAVHARVEDGFVTSYTKKAVGEDHGLNAQGEALWRPYYRDPQPTFDAVLQEAAKTLVISPAEVRWTWTVSDKPASEVREIFRERINDRAESVRKQWITPGSGMAMTYQRKAAEAAAAVADTSPIKTNYPVLSASIGAEIADTGDEAADLTAIAQIVLARQDAFAQAAMAIETVRLKALADIGAASSGAEIKAIYEALSWPSP